MAVSHESGVALEASCAVQAPDHLVDAFQSEVRPGDDEGGRHQVSVTAGLGSGSDSLSVVIVVAKVVVFVVEIHRSVIRRAVSKAREQGRGDRALPGRTVRLIDGGHGRHCC